MNREGAGRAQRPLSRWARGLAIIGALIARSDPASALDPPGETEDPPTSAGGAAVSGEASPGAEEAPLELEVTVQGRPTSRGGLPARGGSRIDRRDMQERQPRSAPDALRYEPGVYVQQSAHGQGSPYIRGRTGQQTVVLFDGIRMSNSTWRQGPNQYFFTVDSQSLHHIDVTRGGASTLFGSDAIAGVIDAHPMEPARMPGEGFRLRPRASVRFASADTDFGTRLSADTQITEDVRFLAGAGIRAAGRLEGGGVVTSPVTGEVPQVPALEEDGRTQLGTGFRELTFDGRLVVRLSPHRRLVVAAYGFRELDAPRTDQCPPPFAPRDECLTYDEQFRSLAYASFEGDLGAAARELRASIAYQRQHELRSLDRPSSFIENTGRDDVDTFGFVLKAATAEIEALPGFNGRLRWGGDVYGDHVDSAAFTGFTDIGALIPLSRGQYLAGSSYVHGGAFVAVEALFREKLGVQIGVRGGAAAANAPSDPASGTEAIDHVWPSFAGNAGIEYRALPALTLFGTYDRSFRAPNLDDLTSRQQSGPGFQFENPDLLPETADSIELGARLTHDQIEADLWVFRSIVHDSISRAFRSITECPPSSPQCATSWARFQLVNARGPSFIDGVELSARGFFPLGFTLRGAFSYARGEGPNPQEPPDDPTLAYEERVPLSRVPPLNGSVELRWSHVPWVSAGAALRWAATQDRLAPTDRSDARIPTGGTPGYAVLDLRAGLRIGKELVFAAVLENVLDTPYRVHGSSVNGPGRGVIFNLEAGP